MLIRVTFEHFLVASIALRWQAAEAKKLEWYEKDIPVHDPGSTDAAPLAYVIGVLLSREPGSAHNATIVHVGCGKGRLVEELRKHG